MATAAHSTDTDKEINPFFYSVPAAPYVASAVTQQEKVSISTTLDAYHDLAGKHDLVIVEGIGGLMVPETRKVIVYCSRLAGGNSGKFQLDMVLT